MLVVWDVALTRPTLDIDLLGKIDNDPDEIRNVIQEICVTEFVCLITISDGRGA